MAACRWVVRFVRGECGATATEYAVLLAFVLGACATAAVVFQAGAGVAFQATGDTIGTYPDP